jgi:hypothetical protein
MQPIPEQLEKPSEPLSMEDCLLLLLRGIQNHPVVAEDADSQGFRNALAALEHQFTGKENAHHTVESAVAILEQYNGHANEIVARQKADLAKASADLTAAASGLATAQSTAERLLSIEKQIGALSTLDDLGTVKARLISEVTTARTEALHEQKKVSDLISGTINQLTAAPEPAANNHVAHVVGPAYVTDPLTGLQPRAQAEDELRHAHELPIDSYLAIFVIKRLALINSKFGFARGDQLLVKIVSQLSQSMPEFNNLFRWAPCAFVVLAPPGTAYRELRAKVQVIEVTRMTPTLEWQGRSAMVPVALDCRVISVRDFGTVSELFLRLDNFAAQSD